MTNLEQLHLFLKFHFAPDSEAKRQIWEEVFGVNEWEYTPENVDTLAGRILMDGFVLSVDDQNFLKIVANPPSFATNDVELAMRLTQALVQYDDDPEAAHVTADEFLVALVEKLGHPAVAEAYRGVNKRCS